MKLIRKLDEFPSPFEGGAVAIGNFDGVHRGHARIVSRLIQAAKDCSGPAIVFTFDPHPVRLLRPKETPPPLTWTERKAHLLGELGVDMMIAYPTDEALLNLSAREFFDQIIRRKLAAGGMVEGPNFVFGHGREGTIDVLRQFTSQAGMTLDIVDPIQRDGELISSSRIRKLIAKGDVGQAATMLTRPYRLRGLVTHGMARGTKIGFPTANVDAVDTMLPASGVYAALGYIDGEPWPAAVNLGPNLTFGEDALKLEVHLIGWQDTLYGQTMEVDFLDRLRDIQQFDGVDALVAQLGKDVAAARQIAIDYLQSEIPRK